jgi:hypothetical protein
MDTGFISIGKETLRSTVVTVDDASIKKWVIQSCNRQRIVVGIANPADKVTVLTPNTEFSGSASVIDWKGDYDGLVASSIKGPCIVYTKLTDEQISKLRTKFDHSVKFETA